MTVEILNATRLELALKGKGWWQDICEHRDAILFWLGLNLLDYALTQVGLSQGGYEINRFLRYLSPLAFALQKFFLTMAAIMWLAMWRWLRFLKWLNLLFAALACFNIYQLIKVY